MHVIGLDVHRSSGPGVIRTDATNLLFDERGDLAHKNLLAVYGAPDNTVAELIRNMFGVLCIHTQQLKQVFYISGRVVGGALPLLER